MKIIFHLFKENPYSLALELIFFTEKLSKTINTVSEK